MYHQILITHIKEVMPAGKENLFSIFELQGLF
jgi:hypothetical protein